MRASKRAMIFDNLTMHLCFSNLFTSKDNPDTQTTSWPQPTCTTFIFNREKKKIPEKDAKIVGSDESKKKKHQKNNNGQNDPYEGFWRTPDNSTGHEGLPIFLFRFFNGTVPASLTPPYFFQEHSSHTSDLATDAKTS